MYREHFGKRNKLRYDDEIAHLDDAAFEELVASHFANQGYRVERSPPASAEAEADADDTRIDMLLHQGRDTIAVRCKHNRLYQVTQKPIQNLAVLAKKAGANSAMLVASGEFTRQARAEAASATRLLLIDGTDLRRMLAPQAAKPAAVSSTTGEMPTSHVTPAYADADPFLPSSIRRWRKIGPPLAAGVIVLTTVLVLVALNEHKERPVPPPPPPPPPPVVSEAELQRQAKLAAEQLRRAQEAARARRAAYDAAMAEQQAKEAELEEAERQHQQKVLDSIPEMDLYPSAPITQEEKAAGKKR